MVIKEVIAMSSRMDKYKENINEEAIPTRSDKNKELYRQIYNAYDEFENLIVPSNAREINPGELKKEIRSREDYHRKKDYDALTNNDKDENNPINNTIIRKEIIKEEQKQEEEIYDINELLNKAKSDNKKPELIEPTLSNADYLKKLKLDNRKTNIEQVKEMYEDIKEESREEDEALLKTANLSLEILSDLKGDNEKTTVSAPIKGDELPENTGTMDFYSNTYKFSKRDFDDHDEVDDEEEEEDDEEEGRTGKIIMRILLVVFGLLLAALVVVYFISYFNK